MFRNFAIGFGAILVLVSVGMATNVQAKLSKVLGVETATGKNLKPQLVLADCDDGAKVLTGAGFKHVFATDCSGAQYQFNGFRGGTEYTIVFNAQSNGFSVISR